MCTLLAEHTNRSLDQISKDIDRDYFMSPLEAKEYGIIDDVVANNNKKNKRKQETANL